MGSRHTSYFSSTTGLSPGLLTVAQSSWAVFGTSVSSRLVSSSKGALSGITICEGGGSTGFAAGGVTCATGGAGTTMGPLTDGLPDEGVVVPAVGGAEPAVGGVEPDGGFEEP